MHFYQKINVFLTANSSLEIKSIRKKLFGDEHSCYIFPNVFGGHGYVLLALFPALPFETGPAHI